MANSHFSIFLFLFFFLLTSTSASSPQSLSNAVETLSNSGYISMSLTLHLTFQTLLRSAATSSSVITVFSPSDDAFSRSGQPSLSLLQYHFSPLNVTADTLLSLPYGSRIPTLSPNRSLIITSSGGGTVSLNGVCVDGSSPVYSNGSLIIYSIDRFFDPEFKIESLAPPSPTAFAGCPTPAEGRRFSGAVNEMRKREFATMAAFLEMQLGQDFGAGTTVFAPVDSVLGDWWRGDFVSILRAHVVPCRLMMEELEKLGDGMTLLTFLTSFVIEVGRSNGLLMLNGVPIHVANMYQDDTLVVHGIHQLLKTPDSASLDFDMSGGNGYSDSH